jgi:hypothetical protein
VTTELEYRLYFNRGNGLEEARETFATLDDAVREANLLREYGQAWWFEFKQGGIVVSEAALRAAEARVDSEDE